MSEILDPGLQAERTWLAWARTGLSFAANGALVVRSGFEEHNDALLAIGLAMFVATTLFAVVGRQRHHHIVTAVRNHRNPMHYRLLALTAWTTIVAGIGIVIISLRYGGNA